MSGLPFSIAALLLVVVLIILEIFRRRDIGARRRIEDLLTEIEAMKWEISSLEKLKSDLLTRIGASLRRPLTEVRESALDLTRPLDSSPEIRHQIEVLTAQIDSIERFLNVLGEIALLEHMEQTEDGAPPLAGAESATVSLDRIVTGVLQDNTQKMTESGLSLTVAMDDPVTVRGSENYLVHAVTSILNEAMRRTSRGGIISVDLRRTPDSVRLRINSRGERPQEAGESAIGIELARQIVSAHGGWLTESSGQADYTASLPPSDGPGQGETG